MNIPNNFISVSDAVEKYGHLQLNFVGLKEGYAIYEHPESNITVVIHNPIFENYTENDFQMVTTINDDFNLYRNGGILPVFLMVYENQVSL